jgi:hypothetical protein
LGSVSWAMFAQEIAYGVHIVAAAGTYTTWKIGNFLFKIVSLGILKLVCQSVLTLSNSLKKTFFWPIVVIRTNVFLETFLHNFYRDSTLLHSEKKFFFILSAQEQWFKTFFWLINWNVYRR